MKLCISKGAQSHIIDISPEASLEFLYDVASQVLDQQCLQLKTGFPLLSLERSTTTTIQSVLHDNDRVTAVTDQDRESVSILNHCRAIRSILDFWFGQYSPDMAQKRLWMIASSSVEHRRKIDKEITSRFKEIVANDQIHEWLSEIFGYQGKIAAIVALDQFSRHIHRYLKEVGNGSFPEQSILDARALAAANIFVDEHENEISCGMIPLPMVVFAIMPFRHTNTLDALQVVQHRVEQLAAIEMQHESMLRRFRKATNRRVALLQDESRRSGSGNSKSSFSENDILEAFHFDADMCSAKEHIVVRSIVQFLADRGIHPDADAIGNRYPIIVSLSGGVDSMVIISVLAYLATQCHFHIHVCAVHIDYANRPESEAEAVFVKNYCEERHVRFFLRRIDEVTRGVTERNEYERVARDARYSSYREAVQVCRHEYGDSSIKVGVFLGHHKGDIRENVLSNAHKGCGPLDLSGMTSESTNDGVVIYRPLLSLEKGDIFDFAHKFGVPYFKDTTPHWSTRGKLRNKLLPLLIEIYGEGSMENLSSLAKESDEAKLLLNTLILGPFLENVGQKQLGIMFPTGPWKNQGLFFWKFVLREVLHRSRLGMLSDKSVESFVDRIGASSVREGWLQCKKDYAVYLREDGKVFILSPESFPFQKEHQFDIENALFRYGVELKIGPWSIVASLVTDDEVYEKSTLLNIKAIQSWENFMDGGIKYYIEVPLEGTNPRPLVFVREFDKASRPRAWKGTDLKIQSTLPLLGNDSQGIYEIAKGAPTVLVGVQMTVRTKQYK